MRNSKLGKTETGLESETGDGRNPKLGWKESESGNPKLASNPVTENQKLGTDPISRTRRWAGLRKRRSESETGHESDTGNAKLAQNPEVKSWLKAHGSKLVAGSSWLRGSMMIAPVGAPPIINLENLLLMVELGLDVWTRHAKTFKFSVGAQ